MLSNVALLEKYGSVRRVLGRIVLHYLREIGLGSKQLVALRLIGKHKKCTMAEIAEGINSDKASVTRVINSLVHAGWLQRGHGISDRRQVFITLTVKGSRNLPKIENIYEQIADQFASALEPKEQKELLRLLSKIENELISKGNRTPRINVES